MVEESSLFPLFLNCDDTFDFLDEERKKRVYQDLVSKVVHAKVNDEAKDYKEKYTGRRSKKRSDTTHRGDLKATSKGSVVKPEN